MFATALTLAVVLSAQAGGGHGRPGGKDGRHWRDRCDRDVAAAFDSVERELATLTASIKRLDSKKEQKRLEDEVDKVKRSLERAEDIACDEAKQKPPVVVVQQPPPPPPPPREPIVLADKGFKELTSAIKKESFDENRQRVLELGVAGDVCVTTDQAKALIHTASFSGNKMLFAKHLIPRIVDRERGFTLPQSMSFPSEKAELSAMLSGMPQLDICKRPAPPPSGW